MEVLTCKICLKIYNEDVSPRVLPCGHTVCSSCLKQIFVNSRQCPMCRTDLIEMDVNEYPVNYSMLETAEAVSRSPFYTDAFKRRLELLTKTHDGILSKIKTYSSKIMANMSKIPMMEEDNKKLHEFLAKDVEEVNIYDANTSLTTIQLEMRQTAQRFFCDKIPKPDVHFRSSDFSTAEDFLMKLFREIQTGQRIVALCIADDEEKYGRLSITDNRMLIHSVRSLAVDVSVKMVELDDLKENFFNNQQWKLNRKFLGFIDLTYDDSGLSHRIVFEFLSQFILVSLFLKLCTGEEGCSYVDASFIIWEGHSIKLQPKQTEFRWENHYLEYFSKVPPPQTDTDNGKFYLACCPNGVFQIAHAEKIENNCFIIGTVVNDESWCDKFSPLSNGTVVDCGIALELYRNSAIHLSFG